jgi:hypothetical protein
VEAWRKRRREAVIVVVSSKRRTHGPPRASRLTRATPATCSGLQRLSHRAASLCCAARWLGTAPGAGVPPFPLCACCQVMLCFCLSCRSLACGGGTLYAAASRERRHRMPPARLRWSNTQRMRSNACCSARGARRRRLEGRAKAWQPLRPRSHERDSAIARQAACLDAPLSTARALRAPRMLELSTPPPQAPAHRSAPHRRGKREIIRRRKREYRPLREPGAGTMLWECRTCGKTEPGRKLGARRIVGGQ